MSIRAIGSPTASVGSVASAYVDYLSNGVQSKGQLAAQRLDGTIDYYHSGIEGPGVWSGHGAHRLGLDGFVDPDDLQSVLSGRHHETGERLLSAQGSAGRYGLKVGAPTREIDGEPVWSRHDLEGHLRLEGDVLTKLLENLDITFASHDDMLYVDAEAVAKINRHVAVKPPSAGRPSSTIDGQDLWSTTDLGERFKIADDLFDGLIDTVSGRRADIDDVSYLTSAQVEQLTSAVHDIQRLDQLHNLKPDALLTASEAAAMTGVSRRYIGKVIGNHLNYEAEGITEDARDKDWLPGQRHHPDNPQSNWRVRADDLAGFIERRQPPAVRIAYDVTFTFEKSVSVVGMLTEGNDRDAFTAAVQRANQVGLDYLDQHASDGRERGKPIHSEGLAVASFIHSTSRNDDPFVHVHNLVINAVQDENGTGRALDARDLYLRGPTAAALASAELRWELSQSLGVQWVAGNKGVEIAGVGARIIDEFSTGRNRIQSIVDEAGINSTAKVRQHIATESRPDKSGSAPDLLVDEWRARASQHGLDDDRLNNVILHNGPRSVPRPELTRRELDELTTWLASKDGVTNNTSIFTKGDLLRTIGEWTPEDSETVRVMPSVELNRVADAFLASPHVVPLDLDKEVVAELAGKVTPKMQHEPVFSTAAMISTQNHIGDLWRNGIADESGTVSTSALDAALADSPTLTKAQSDLVRSWTTSGHQYQAAVGVPGAGKTFAVATAARAWESEGYKVIGAAVAGTAAQHLGDDAGITSETIGYYISQIETFGNGPFDAKTVLIVDEAGTISDNDLENLMTHAGNAGATVRFLGDPEQHGAVNAGGMWKHLVSAYEAETPQLLESFRFKDSPVDVEVNDLIRDDQIEEAFRVLKSAGNLIEVGSEHEALATSLRLAVQARDNNNANPMIERNNTNRVLLNGAMQHIRIQRGEVTSVRTYGPNQYGIGDEIVSKKNNRTLHPADDNDAYLRNGTQGVIVGHNNETNAAIADFGKGLVEIPADELATPAFDLGYAVTSHAVQGATLPTSNSRLSAGASKAEALVNVSRGKKDNHVILTGNSDEELSAFHEESGTTLAVDVAAAIGASQDVPASIADTQAGQRDTNLARVHQTTEEGPAVDFARQSLARTAITRPSPALTEHLPIKSTVPHLARRYDEAIVDASIYQATYQPYPSANGPWSSFIGEAPDPEHASQSQVQLYNRAVESLRTVSVNTTMRSLEEVGVATLPQWVPVEIEILASSGLITPDFSPETFGALVTKLGDTPPPAEALAKQLSTPDSAQAPTPQLPAPSIASDGLGDLDEVLEPHDAGVSL